MVQRLGRVLRPKAGGGPGRFLIAYVHGTIEDPATGAHEGLLEMVGEIPGQVRLFQDVSDVDDIARFLAGDDRVGVPVPSLFSGPAPPESSTREQVLPDNPGAYLGVDAAKSTTVNSDLGQADERDDAAHLQPHRKDTQEEVFSLKQSLAQAESQRTELERLLRLQGDDLAHVTEERDEAQRALQSIRDAEEGTLAERAQLEQLLLDKTVALAEALETKEQLEQLLVDKGVALADAAEERDEALRQLEERRELERLLRETSAALTQALAQRDAARRTAEEAELKATRTLQQLTEWTNREVDTEQRLYAEIARLKDLLVAQETRAQALEAANEQLAHRVEGAETRSESAEARIADLERRLRRVPAEGSDPLTPQAGRERHDTTVRGVRIRTSMKPDKMRSLGDLLGRASEG